jgi:hypothetical protein
MVCARVPACVRVHAHARVCLRIYRLLTTDSNTHSGGYNVQTKYPQISVFEMGSCQNSSC